MTRPPEHLTDSQIDALVDAMLARAREAGLPFDAWLDREYRRACPWWLRVWHRLSRWWR